MEVEKLGLIAGNGRFPFLVLDQARNRRLPVVVAAIREEADPGLEEITGELSGGSSFHWIGLGQLGKLVRVFKNTGIRHAVMAGQVKHVRIFAAGVRTPAGILSSLPDGKMLRMLASLRRRNTRSLIEGVIGVLRAEGIEVLDSTWLLADLIPGRGVLTRRKPNNREKRDMEYGLEVAKELSRLDLGQTVVVKDRAVVAVEAMEGTDATIRRAAGLVAGSRLTVVKAGRARNEMRYDVPVIGSETLNVLRECRVSALSIDSGRTLILDRDHFVHGADESRITVVCQ